MYGKPSARGKAASEDEGADSELEEIFAGVSDADSGEDEEEDSDAPDAGTANKAKSAIRAALGSSKRQPVKKMELVDEALPESEYNVSMGKQHQSPTSHQQLPNLLQSRLISFLMCVQVAQQGSFLWQIC